MVAFQFRMPAGIAGEVNRISAATIEPQVITPFGTTGAPTAYGVPMVVDNTGGNVGNMRTIASGDTTVYGLLARPYPTGGTQDGLGVSTPNASGACDIMVRGYMLVLLSGATAATKGGQTYVWTGASSSAHPVIGGFEAASATGMIVPNLHFMGPADASGFVEVAFNI